MLSQDKFPMASLVPFPPPSAGDGSVCSKKQWITAKSNSSSLSVCPKRDSTLFLHEVISPFEAGELRLLSSSSSSSSSSDVPWSS
jgi:hypothetical protein